MIARFVASPCENSLTAGVFSHLLHLPFDICWGIIRSACCSANLPAYPGEPIHVDPWPIWSARDTTNSSYVEPDFFLRFAGFDLIIEAKRWDHGMQSHAQWMRELVAYGNEYGAERKEVRMLAVGGIHGINDEMLSHLWRPSTDDPNDRGGETHLFECEVHMCRWSRLLAECLRMERELKRLETPTPQTFAHRRILSDLIAFFSSHGFQTGIWYNETLPSRPRLGSTAHSVFRYLQNRFQES